MELGFANSLLESFLDSRSSTNYFSILVSNWHFSSLDRESRLFLDNPGCIVSIVYTPTAMFFRTFFNWGWKVKCNVIPRYLHSHFFLTTTTISESSCLFSFSREKVMNSVLLPFKFKGTQSNFQVSKYLFANLAKQCQRPSDYKKANNHRRTGKCENPPLSVQSGH